MANTLTFFPSVLPSDQPNGPPLADLGEEPETLCVWVVNITAGKFYIMTGLDPHTDGITAGTSVILQVRDTTGAVALSAPFTVQAGGTFL